MKKIKYSLDKLISQNPNRLLLIVSVLSLLILSIIASLITLFNPKTSNFFENFGELINITLDPSIKIDNNYFVTFLYVLVALLGLLLFSVLIGMLTSIIESRIIELKRGRSPIIESNHTIFLGWSNKIFTAIRELSEANSSMKSSSIVVMSIRDKVFMEDYLFREIPENSNTSVICRTGDPSDFKDLELISPSTARSIVLFSTEDEYSDSIVLKRALSLQKNELVNCPIVAEVNSLENADALKLLSKLTVIQPRNLIMRILAHSLKEPGLSKVYSELLTFEGKEIYFWPLNEKNHSFEKYIVGKKFKDIIFEFEISSIIGVVKDFMNLGADAQTDSVKLLPDFDYEIKSTDRLILISEDDTTIGGSVGKSIFNSNKNIEINLKNNIVYPSRHITIIGWHSWGEILLNELNIQLPKNSTIEIFYNPEFTNSPNIETLNSFKNISINLNKIHDLKKESFYSINWSQTDSILILGYRDKLNIQQADSYNLLSFTHIKHFRDNNKSKINICCEILDPKNGELIEGTRDDEFVASDDLVAKYLIQLSENKYLKSVYTDLLDDDGAELYLRSSEIYVSSDITIKFGDLVALGLTRDEIVIGVQLKENATSHKVNSILSPPKSSEIFIQKHDKIIVLANN